MLHFYIRGLVSICYLGSQITLANAWADNVHIENGEGLQVLHYEAGQKYEPHFDYFMDEFNTKNGGQRMATVLMYL